MAVSVIVPTKGRPTLAQTLVSIYGQLDADDEIIVVADGPNFAVRQIADCFPGVRCLCTTTETKNSGASQRDLGIENARCSHLAFLDDDDEMDEGALMTMRKYAALDAGKLHIFRMMYGKNSPTPGLVLWAEPVLRVCNIGTPMVLVPRSLRYMPLWADYDHVMTVHDFHWISEVARFADPEFHEEIVAVIRP